MKDKLVKLPGKRGNGPKKLTVSVEVDDLNDAPEQFKLIVDGGNERDAVYYLTMAINMLTPATYVGEG